MKKNILSILLATIILVLSLSSFAQQQAEFTVSPASLYDSLQRNQTSTKIITLHNNGPDDHHYTLSVEGGLFPTPSMTVKSVKSGTREKTGAAPASLAMYSTTFEEFEEGDITGQLGWDEYSAGWSVERENPAAGRQHLRGLSEGFSGHYEYTVAASPYVDRGLSRKSTVTMKVNVQGTGVTWHIVPQSFGPNVTKVVFNADGTVSALVADSWYESHYELIGPTPTGYFDLTIEVDRESYEYNVYFNDDKVFTGKAFYGDISNVMFLSDVEVAGPTIDIDNLIIIDGTYEEFPEFLSATPTSGILPAGDSVEIEVTFNSTDLTYGTYRSSLVFDIDGTSVKVPAELRVYGDPDIEVSPTELQASADYKGKDTKTFTIKNTGENPLNYNLQLTNDATTWMSVNPASGTIPIWESVEIEVSFDASALDSGLYVGGIIVNSNAPANPVVDMVASFDIRTPGQIGLSANSLYQEVKSGERASQTFRIENHGGSVLRYAFDNIPVPPDVPGWMQYGDTISGAKPEPLAEISPINQTLTQYATDFEDFTPGEINGQNGWSREGGDWSIKQGEAYEGSFHLRGVANGSGEAASPYVPIGSQLISSTVFRMKFEEGATWEIGPISPAGGKYVTRFQVLPDGALRVLIDRNGHHWYEWVHVPGRLPSGWFEFRMDLNRLTAVYTIFIDGEELYTGQGQTGNIEQVRFSSRFAGNGGQTFDVDNFAIYDGALKAPWLTYNPKAGYVQPGQSKTITVGFNATDLTRGTYYDTLHLSSNDINTPPLSIPLELQVISPPVIAAIDSAEITETGSLNVTFTATDPEGTNLPVVLRENLSFITPISSANGTATYSIKPTVGDAGEYVLAVVATDADGESDTETFHLTVVPYGVQDLSVIVTATNETITTFNDTVTVDVTDPLFSSYTIRANTNPTVVGSVRFWVDGQLVNNENEATYVLTPSKLGQLSGGYHTILARSYTKASGGGVQGRSQTAVISIINSAAVTDFDVVKHPNTKLIDLTDGAVIDISQAAYKKINVQVNTSGVVKSIVFRLNGNVFRYDNAAPYQLNGVNGSNDIAWPVTPGVYTVTATPYSKFNGQGIEGQPLTVTFQVVNGGAAGAGPPPAFVAETNELKVYPNPFETNFTIEPDESGELDVSLIDLTGRELIKTQVTQQPVTLGDQLAPGIYLLRINTNGRSSVRRMVKK